MDLTGPPARLSTTPAQTTAGRAQAGANPPASASATRAPEPGAQTRANPLAGGKQSPSASGSGDQAGANPPAGNSQSARTPETQP
jgi:hypothetical protein